VDSFRTVLNRVDPGQWASASFFNGNDTDNALFYKPSKVTVVGAWAWYPNPATNLRFVTVWRLKPVGYTAAASELRIYSVHLKASMGFESDRLQEAIGIRDSMNAMPPGTHAILLGDFNIYTGTEAAFGKLLESQADNDGRLYDPLGLQGINWDNNGTYAAIHTQCPCLTCPSGFGFSGGGLDSRFDMFLPTYNMNNGTGFELLTSTYKPVANDGLHFNKGINEAPVIPEGQPYADALWYASDHLPVRVDIQLPARITLVFNPAFGTVIVGATASQALTVSNPAVAPADNLDYSMTADPGFGAPGGGFSVAPGGSSSPHTITMNTAVAGVKSGQLHITSDAPDAPTTNVSLSGTVLDHAIASLDSGTTVQAALLDLGDHPAGSFTDGSVRVYNQGWDALQARLAVSNGVITGGDGRFTIVGGFTPALLSGAPATYGVHFDDNAATVDSTYNATLTFTSSDEALPGGAAQAPLVVTLRARPTAPTDTQASVRPAFTRLYAPYPNPPLADGTTVRFDLAQRADLRLEVFDVAGRRVARLASHGFDPGVHEMHWNGRSDEGRSLGAGVYFVRLSAPNLTTQTVRVTLLR
jgi:hypothetical protein